MRRLAALAALAVPLGAHVMSMSSGDVVVRGSRAHYELRMPDYEVAHIKNPETSIFRHLRFASSGRDARLVSARCRPNSGSGSYLCSAEYDFAGPVDRLDVECTFYAITVPNHVHLLRAARDDGKRDQGLFDISFPRATLRFDPPGAVEIAVSQAVAGFGRAFTPVQLLFLLSLVLAARSRRELFSLAGMFLAGQIASAAVVPQTSWYPAARFVEAAAALTVAYLSVEILLLPRAGARWAIAGVLGGFHGLYFALFLRTSEYHAVWVLAGAALAQALILSLLAFLFARASRAVPGPAAVRVCASVLLAAGMGWFVMRMAG